MNFSKISHPNFSRFITLCLVGLIVQPTSNSFAGQFLLTFFKLKLGVRDKFVHLLIAEKLDLAKNSGAMGWIRYIREFVITRFVITRESWSPKIGEELHAV